MRRLTFIDIAILALVFWSVWSLRFAGVENTGLWTMLAAVGAGAALLAIRKESWRDIGLRGRVTLECLLLAHSSRWQFSQTSRG